MDHSPASPLSFAKDEYGKDILLKNGKFQVMMEWEKPYMEACIDALKPSGDVLEVGFGCGYSARHIQKYQPKSHTIIECDPVVYEKALSFAKEFSNVTIVFDTWQNALPRLGVFDAIFFDDYPLESEEELNFLAQEKTKTHAALLQGHKVLEEAIRKIPTLESIRYSDADLEEFLKEVLSRKDIPEGHITQFFTELKDRGQITTSQYEKVWDKLLALGFVRPEPCLEKQEKILFSGPREKFYTFLEQALKAHMRKGSRFSCFLSSSTSKFEDPKFFQEIILNPYLDYHEKRIEIEVPSNCTYYTDPEALVIVITLQEDRFAN